MLADLAFSPVVEASGGVTVTIRTRTRLQTWMLQQVSVEMPSAPLGATCELRKNGFLITPLIATGDAADGDPYVQLRGSDVATVTFAGCTPGDVGQVFVIYDDGNTGT